jgi:hypothetical protein
VLGSDKNLALRFAAARWHEEDAASGLGAHARGRDAPTSQPPRGSAGADEFEHGVSVYVDERLVGVAHGGHFNLSGLLPGMHTLQIVARDEMGNDQEVCVRWRVRTVAQGVLVAPEISPLTARRFHLPAPRRASFPGPLHLRHERVSGQ